jgi:hypothetical protein
LLTCQIFLRVFPCTIIFLKANIFPFSASQNSCSFWTAILFFATRRIWADIPRVIQPIRLQNSSYTVDDYIIIYNIVCYIFYSIEYFIYNIKCLFIIFLYYKYTYFFVPSKQNIFLPSSKHQTCRKHDILLSIWTSLIRQMCEFSIKSMWIFWFQLSKWILCFQKYTAGLCSSPALHFM